MKQTGCYILICVFLLNVTAFAVPRSVVAAVPAPAIEKPQMARDMEGLDPKEGTVSKGLRGSFTIRHYISGPWTGGTAVIEVASDSSYAEVRIFDKDGNLQRIYSIQPKAQNARNAPAPSKDPMDMVRADPKYQGTQGSNEAMNVTRSPEREAAVEAQTAQAIQDDRESQQKSAVSRGRRGTVSNRAGDIREEAPPEVAALPVQPRASVQPAAPKKRVIRVRRKRPARKKKVSSLDTPLSGAPVQKEEDEYYYEEVVVVDKRPSAAPPPAEEKPVQVAKAEPPPPPPPPPPVQQPVVASVPRSSSRSSPRSTQEASQPPARDLDHSAPRSAGTIPGTENLPAPSSSKPGSSGSSAAYDDANLPDVTEAVRENETENERGSKGTHPSVEKSEKRPKETERKAAAAPVPEKTETSFKEPEPAVAAAPVPEKVEKRHLESDAWKPKPTVVVALPGSAVDVPDVSPVAKTERVRQTAVVPEDLTEAQKAAAKLDSDNWSPKAPKAAPTDAELGLTDLGDASGSQKSNRAKKGSKYEDEMVPMSDQAKRGSQVGAGDSWSPSAKPAKLSAKEEQTIAMINTLKAPPQTPVARINRDINNPEEGVKPFYSLEKYSGAQFGRHREFERRVMYKQNKASSFKGYDFYIDEVDRKQEKHYLYYYKIDPKTKKAKLMATEKHEKVTFLGNYDIGSEDKGKIDKE